MDSALSWIILVILVYFLFFLAIKKAQQEKEQYESENDTFFKEWDRDRGRF